MSPGLSIHADLMLMDDRKGVAAARRKGLEVTGALGPLIRPASQGLVDLARAIEALKQTNVRHRQEMLGDLLRKYWKSE